MGKWMASGCCLAVAALVLMCCYGAMGQDAEVVVDDQEGAKRIGPAAIFTAIDTVGEIAGDVFEIIDAFSPDPALEQLNTKLDNLDTKMTNVQTQLTEVGTKVDELVVSCQVNTDSIINEIVNVAMEGYVNAINSATGDLRDKITYFDQMSKTDKDSAFKDGTFVNEIKQVCSLSNTQRTKENVEGLAGYMVGNSRYTGALDAYTNTLINRMTIAPAGQYPACTLEQAYQLLADYYAENVMVLFKGVTYIQVHYCANKSSGEAIVFYERLQSEKLKPLAAKFLSCVNRMVMAQANFRSVNDTEYAELFKTIYRDGVSVYDLGIVDGIYRQADFLAAETVYLKIKGKATIQDDAGNTKEIVTLINRKKLGLFVRVFGDPSRLPVAASYAEPGAAAKILASPSGYSNLVGVVGHLDWLWGSRDEDYRWWKKVNGACVALYHRIDDAMTDTGNYELSFSVDYPTAANGAAGSARHTRVGTYRGSYTLWDYDVTTGHAAGSTTPAANRVKMEYEYRYNYCGRGFQRVDYWNRSWETIGARSYGTEYEYCSNYMDMNYSPNYFSPYGWYATGKLAGRNGNRIRNYWGLNFYQIRQHGDASNWGNAGNAAVRLSVRDNYYFQLDMVNFLSKFWVAFDLADGYVSCNTDNYNYTYENWNVSTSDALAAPVRLVGNKEFSAGNDKTVYTAVYDMWPRMTVNPRGAVRLRYALGQAISFTWYWWEPEKNYSAFTFGSQTRKFEVFADYKENDTAWVAVREGSGAKNRLVGAKAANAATRLFALTMPFGPGKAQVVELKDMPEGLELLGSGDFDGDGRQDILARVTETNAIVFAPGAIIEATETVSRVLRTLSPLLGSITVLGEGETFLATADFNGDDTDDLLVRQADGAWKILYVNAGVVTSENADLPPLPDGALVATGDFNGDGKADFLFEDQTNANPVFTLLFDGDTPSTRDLPLTEVGTPWSVVFATEDCDGNGVEDLIWEDQATGEIYLTLFDASGNTSASGPARPSGSPWKQGWRLMSAADFNADGRADYLWIRDNGKKTGLRVSYMNGLAPMKGKGARSGGVRTGKFTFPTGAFGVR